ncbi:MAG: hypothetical protein JWM47_4212 [Acidimicrobiales bacterium]|nr:hypothetical protein [Acidimicrobiales bacterium]
MALGRWAGPFEAKGWTWAKHRLRSIAGLRGNVPKPALSVSRFDRPGMGSDANRPRPAAGDKPLKVLVFSHNLRSEGASISLKELAAGLARDPDLALEIVAFEDGPLRLAYASLGIPVTLRRPVHHRIWALARLHAETTALADFMRQSGAQVVLANTLLGFPVILAAEEAGLPSVWIPRESEPWDEYFRFLPDPVAQKAIAAIGLPRRVVFVAEATRKVWHPFDKMGRFTVVHNALDPQRFSAWIGGDRPATRAALGWADDEAVFLCTGTVCERKGQHDAIDALDLIGNGNQGRIRIVFVGDASSEYGRRLQRRAQHRTGVQLRVDFVPPTLEIGRYYLASDVFLLCSRVESFPRVTLEAMAFAMPVIATPVFGVTEQLHAPDDACFYAPADSQHLSRLILSMAHQPGIRALYSARSSAALTRLPSFDQMCASYRNVLVDAAREAAAQPT